MLLRAKDKQTLVNIFETATLPIDVWAYGSRVNGTAHDGSDLDLVIRTKDLKQLPIDIYVAFKDKIRESNIPILVDVFDWARLPDSFQKNIEVQHEILFSNIPFVLNEPEPLYQHKNSE